MPEGFVKYQEELQGKRAKIANFADNSGNVMKQNITTEDIKAARAKFDSYGSEWEKAYFDEKSGGFNVYHKDHKFSKIGGGGEAEKIVGKILARNEGKQIEFLPEGEEPLPDVKFDNKTWDIKYIDHSNEDTIRATIKNARKADNAIYYFKQEGKYQLLKNATDREVGRFLKRQTSTLPDIYFIDKHGFLKLFWKK